MLVRTFLKNTENLNPKLVLMTPDEVPISFNMEPSPRNFIECLRNPGHAHLQLWEFRECFSAYPYALILATFSFEEDFILVNPVTERPPYLAQEIPVRQQVLEEAIKVVNGPRNQDYGGPESSFALIAELWSVYLQGRGFIEARLTPWDTALMMDLMKTARLVQSGGKHRDSWVDKAGYSGCGAEVAL